MTDVLVMIRDGVVVLFVALTLFLLVFTFCAFMISGKDKDDEGNG
jgi:hypothetical protein